MYASLTATVLPLPRSNEKLAKKPHEPFGSFCCIRKFTAWPVWSGVTVTVYSGHPVCGGWVHDDL